MASMVHFTVFASLMVEMTAPFQTHFETVKAKQGTEAVLSCYLDVGSYQQTQTFWYHQRNNSDPPRIVEERRGVRLRATYDNQRQLIISSSRKDHEGIYLCISIKPESILCKIQLTVTRPPKIAKSMSQNVTVAAGQTITLRCHVTGSPRPTVTWHRRSKYDFLDTGVTGTHLIVHKLTREAGGIYTCLAKNDLGADAHDIFVTVTFPPEIDVYEEVLLVPERNETTLMCRVTANPMPETIGWTKGSEPGMLRENYRYALRTDTELLEEYHTLLLLLTLRPGILSGDHYDEYWCRVQGYGDDIRKRVVIKKP